MRAVFDVVGVEVVVAAEDDVDEARGEGAG